jgi:hypothetical protein
MPFDHYSPSVVIGVVCRSSACVFFVPALSWNHVAQVRRNVQFNHGLPEEWQVHVRHAHVDEALIADQHELGDFFSLDEAGSGRIATTR